MNYGELTALIVDDFATIRRIIKGILYDNGFRSMVEAETGAAAVDILNTRKVDLIISDWNMPQMTGIELLKWVRSNEATKGIPFIMVTTENEKANIVEAVRAKVSNYITKPFTAETLTEKLKKVLVQD